VFALSIRAWTLVAMPSASVVIVIVTGGSAAACTLAAVTVTPGTTSAKVLLLEVTSNWPTGPSTVSLASAAVVVTAAAPRFSPVGSPAAATLAAPAAPPSRAVSCRVYWPGAISTAEAL
jgi:hypothetical protein